MGFFTGFLTAGLYVMAGNSLGGALRPMSCEKAVPLEQSYVKKYDAACTKQQSKVTATQTKIDTATVSSTDTSLSAKAQKKAANDLRRYKRLILNYQKLANRDCGNLSKAETRLDTVINKCQAPT